MPATDHGSLRRERLAAARLYLVCAARPAGRELGAFLAAAIRGGVQVVQLRDKHLRGRELTAAAAAAAGICRELGALFMVNDEPAAASAAGADGVHVGQHDMPVADVRALLGPDLLIGLSTHSRAQVDAASATADRKQRPDYIGVGPVFETPTKPGRPAVGVELVRYASRAEVPFFAIGGIDESNVREVLGAGARRIAVVRAIALAEHPEHMARTLRERLDEVSDEHAYRAVTAA
jgi:thiamine-phosphate pyrophosphorylase